MPGSEKPLAFAKRRDLTFPIGKKFRTPILLPSFSSKGFPFLQDVFDVMKEHISDELLVSAYDIGRNKLEASFDFASLVYLDSGGYESTKDMDLSDTYEHDYAVQKWTADDYQQVLDGWTCTSPTVFVSYDGPESRESYSSQIEMAAQLRIPPGPHAKTLLLKPQTSDSRRHKMDDLVAACRHMDQFPVIGVTEKEIGNSILSRMSNIARLRIALDRLFDDRPIHVFGSLDTVSTFLYFLAGADIFDGLSWLRYAFVGGDTLYRHQFAMQLPVSTNSDVVEGSTWTSNYRHTRTMLIQMRKFLLDGDFLHFGPYHQQIKDAFDAMKAELAGD